MSEDYDRADLQSDQMYELREELRLANEERIKLRAAITAAGFAVMETSGVWSIHDVSEHGKAEEANSLEVATRNVELEIENERLRNRLSCQHCSGHGSINHFPCEHCNASGLA